MKRILTSMGLAVAVALGVAGCVYEPTPYYAAPAPYYGPAYYGPAYYGPPVALGVTVGGGHRHRW